MIANQSNHPATQNLPNPDLWVFSLLNDDVDYPLHPGGDDGFAFGDAFQRRLVSGRQGFAAGHGLLRRCLPLPGGEALSCGAHADGRSRGEHRATGTFASRGGAALCADD